MTDSNRPAIEDSAESSTTDELRATRSRSFPRASSKASRTSGTAVTSTPPSTRSENTVVNTMPGKVGRPTWAAVAKALALPPVSVASRAAAAPSSTTSGRPLAAPRSARGVAPDTSMITTSRSLRCSASHREPGRGYDTICSWRAAAANTRHTRWSLRHGDKGAKRSSSNDFVRSRAVTTSPRFATGCWRIWPPARPRHARQARTDVPANLHSSVSRRDRSAADGVARRCTRRPRVSCWKSLPNLWRTSAA